MKKVHLLGAFVLLLCVFMISCKQGNTSAPTENPPKVDSSSQNDSIIGVKVDEIYKPYREKAQALLNEDKSGMYESYKKDAEILSKEQDKAARKVKGDAIMKKYAAFMGEVYKKVLPNPQEVQAQIKAVMGKNEVSFGPFGEYYYGPNSPMTPVSPTRPTITNFTCDFNELFATSNSAALPCGLRASASISNNTSNQEGEARVGTSVRYPSSRGFYVAAHHNYDYNVAVYTPLVSSVGTAKIEIGLLVKEGTNAPLRFVTKSRTARMGVLPLWQYTSYEPHFVSAPANKIFGMRNSGNLTIQVFGYAKVSASGAIYTVDAGVIISNIDDIQTLVY